MRFPNFKPSFTVSPEVYEKDFIANLYAKPEQLAWYPTISIHALQNKPTFKGLDEKVTQSIHTKCKLFYMQILSRFFWSEQIMCAKKSLHCSTFSHCIYLAICLKIVTYTVKTLSMTVSASKQFLTRHQAFASYLLFLPVFQKQMFLPLCANHFTLFLFQRNLKIYFSQYILHFWTSEANYLALIKSNIKEQNEVISFRTYFCRRKIRMAYEDSGLQVKNRVGINLLKEFWILGLFYKDLIWKQALT